MRLVERREYNNSARFATEDGLAYSNAILHDWLIRPLGLTIVRYGGKRFGVRFDRRRVVVDIGRFAFLFWGFAPRRLA